MIKKIPKDQPVHVLSIGTRILVKDVMDQFLRSLGEVKTFYASKMSMALESYLEKQPQVIFCEQTFPEGSAIEFIECIGGLDTAADRYFVLATESSSDTLVALAMEKGIDELLAKPFSTEDVHQIMERYFDKRGMGELDWVKDLRAARKAFLEKRFQEADDLFGAAAKAHWHNSGVLLDCADYFFQRGQGPKALPLLEKVLGESPNNVRALHLYGVLLKRLGRFREAVEKFNQANYLSSLNSVRNCELADVYVQMAEEQIQMALRNDQESSSLILRKAQYQLLRKDYAALVTYLDAKRAFLSEFGRKEADVYVLQAKKLGGIK